MYKTNKLQYIFLCIISIYRVHKNMYNTLIKLSNPNKEINTTKPNKERQVNIMTFKEIKEELKKSVSNVKYFNKETYEIIIKDIKTAKEILESGGNVQEFYKNSKTAKTRFYLENGGAYCQLLTIIS